MANQEFWSAAFSSQTGQWDSPPDLIEELSANFTWDIDVCASGPNVCARYYTEQDDGLSQVWRGLAYMNPPYGKEIAAWMSAAVRTVTLWPLVGVNEAIKTAVVSLIPARTDTTWWQSSMRSASQVVHINKRLVFGSQAYWEWRWDTPMIPDGKGGLKKNSLYGKHGTKQSAPFPSAFAVFGKLEPAQHKSLARYGLTAHYYQGWSPKEGTYVEEFKNR